MHVAKWTRNPCLRKKIQNKINQRPLSPRQRTVGIMKRTWQSHPRSASRRYSGRIFRCVLYYRTIFFFYDSILGAWTTPLTYGGTLKWRELWGHFYLLHTAKPPKVWNDPSSSWTAFMPWIWVGMWLWYVREDRCPRVDCRDPGEAVLTLNVCPEICIKGEPS